MYLIASLALRFPVRLFSDSSCSASSGLCSAALRFRLFLVHHFRPSICFGIRLAVYSVSLDSDACGCHFVRHAPPCTHFAGVVERRAGCFSVFVHRCCFCWLLLLVAFAGCFCWLLLLAMRPIYFWYRNVRNYCPLSILQNPAAASTGITGAS